MAQHARKTREKRREQRGKKTLNDRYHPHFAQVTEEESCLPTADVKLHPTRQEQFNGEVWMFHCGPMLEDKYECRLAKFLKTHLRKDRFRGVGEYEPRYVPNRQTTLPEYLRYKKYEWGAFLHYLCAKKGLRKFALPSLHVNRVMQKHIEKEVDEFLKSAAGFKFRV